MSSVQDVANCPRCVKKGAYIFDCRTSDEWFQCFYCGYQYYTETEVDKEKSSEEDPVFSRKEYETKGFGSYSISHRKGASPFGIFDRPVDDEVVSWFKECLKDPGVDPTASYLTRWNEKNQSVEYLINSPVCAFSGELKEFES